MGNGLKIASPQRQPGRRHPYMSGIQSHVTDISVAEHGLAPEDESDLAEVIPDTTDYAMVGSFFERLFASLERPEEKSDPASGSAAQSSVAVCPPKTGKHCGSGKKNTLTVKKKRPHATDAEYDKAAANSFNSLTNAHKADIWSTCYSVNSDHIKWIVDQAKRERKNLIILSGTHGSRNGRRNARSIDGALYQEDCIAYAWESLDCMRSIQVMDITSLSDAELGKILHGPTSVVLAFCYSRNDSQIRRHMGWHAKKNCVKPLVSADQIDTAEKNRSTLTKN